MRNGEHAVVVTGAGSGIGQAISERLRADGRRVIGLSLDGASGTRPFDVRDEACWDALSHEGVTGLVHAAGVRLRSPLAETSLESFRDVIDVNVSGTFLALRWAARTPERLAPAQRPGGATAPARMSIVTLSSAAVDRLPGEQYAYNASKAAVNTLTQSAAKELAPRGIRVNAIAPGSILTPMTAAGWDDAQHAARMRTEIPTGRPGDPQEIAAVASFLLSDASSYITGTTLTVDGGWSA